MEVPNVTRSSCISRLLSSARSLALLRSTEKIGCWTVSQNFQQGISGSMALVKYLPETLFPPLPFVLCSLCFLCRRMSGLFSLSFSLAQLSNLSRNTPGKLPLIGCYLGLLAVSVDFQLPERLLWSSQSLQNISGTQSAVFSLRDEFFPFKNESLHF